ILLPLGGGPVRWPAGLLAIAVLAPRPAARPVAVASLVGRTRSTPLIDPASRGRPVGCLTTRAIDGDVPTGHVVGPGQSWPSRSDARREFGVLHGRDPLDVVPEVVGAAGTEDPHATEDAGRAQVEPSAVEIRLEQTRRCRPLESFRLAVPDDEGDQPSRDGNGRFEELHHPLDPLLAGEGEAEFAVEPGVLVGGTAEHEVH